MRRILLTAFLLSFLFRYELLATAAMAKTSGMRCNQCHKGRDIPTAGIPPLKGKGIRYLQRMINVEGYVPKYNYRENDYLAAKIEANRKKLENPEPSPASSDKTESSTVSTVKIESNSSTVTQKVEVAPTSNTLDGTVADQSKVQKDSNLTPGSVETASPFVKTIVRKKVDEEPQVVNQIPNTEKVLSSDDGQIQFKGGKTFILKRPKVKPGTRYSWEEDWSFDDYY